MKVCPKDPSHKGFLTTAHEMHEWVVDGDGNFISDNGCIEVTHKPHPDNVWTCNLCGAEAITSA